MTEGIGSLVIGIGNPLRRDDGVGWRLAAEWQLLEPAAPGARVLAVQQVLPELAATLAHSNRVLFIDAVVPGAMNAAPASGGEGPWLQPLAPPEAETAPQAISHGLSPAVLLALAATLYGHRPTAHQLLLEARSVGHGTTYSARLRRQLPGARQRLRDWLEAGDA